MMKKWIIPVFILIGMLFAQEEQQQQSMSVFDRQSEQYRRSMERFYQERSFTRTVVNQVLEDTLEARDYVVGPGDQFTLHIFGGLEDQFSFTVLPEGVVLIPTIGPLEISGLTLKKSKRKIVNFVKDYYVNADISVNLTALRKYRVYLSGEVNEPGTYFIQRTDRLSDILEASGMVGVEEGSNTATIGLNDWADETRIQIRHENGQCDTVDLSRFYRNGDKNENPYLNGGDVIYVPSIDLTKDYVTIEGNVGYQGIYSLRPDEDLFEFLRRVQALNKRSNLESIILFRDGERNDVDLINNMAAYVDYDLQNRDRIIIPTTYNRVYVRGEVMNPGGYPYLANYKARDYIGQAGALDTAVGMDEISVIRHETGEILKGADVVVKKGDTVILPKRTREVFKDYMSILMPIVSIAISTVALIAR